MIRAATLAVVFLQCHAALAAPLRIAVAEEDARCGAPPSAAAGWFYLGAPGRISDGPTALRALAALNTVFGKTLPRDPACLHVEILDKSALDDRYKKMGRRGPKDSIVGFHTRKLGADSTVYVVPTAGQGLDVVIVHEVLHALSHRYTAEAARHGLDHMVEGATEFITRSVAAAALGIPARSFKTGYGRYVTFYEALIGRLGEDGRADLTDAYFIGGYDAFEKKVDQRLGVSLRAAARALQSDDLKTALSLIAGR